MFLTVVSILVDRGTGFGKPIEKGKSVKIMAGIVSGALLGVIALIFLCVCIYRLKKRFATLNIHIQSFDTVSRLNNNNFRIWFGFRRSIKRKQVPDSILDLPQNNEQVLRESNISSYDYESSATQVIKAEPKTSFQKLLNAIPFSKAKSKKLSTSLAMADRVDGVGENAYAVSDSLYTLEKPSDNSVDGYDRPLSNDSSLYSREMAVNSSQDPEQHVYAQMRCDDVSGNNSGVATTEESEQKNSMHTSGHSISSSVRRHPIHRQMALYSPKHDAARASDIDSQDEYDNTEPPTYENCQDQRRGEYAVPYAVMSESTYDVPDGVTIPNNTEDTNPIYTYADPGHIPLDVPETPALTLKLNEFQASPVNDNNDKSPMYLPMTSPVSTLQNPDLQNHKSLKCTLSSSNLE